MNKSQSAFGGALAFVVALSVLGCRDRNIEEPSAASVRVSPATLDLRVGDTARLVVRDERDHLVTRAQFEASSANVAVDAAGLVEANAVGTAMVRVSTDAGSTQVPVTVR